MNSKQRRTAKRKTRAAEWLREHRIALQRDKDQKQERKRS